MLHAFIRKLRSLQRRRDLDFDDEIATHVALLAERYARQGMRPDEAAHAARRQFGNTTLLREDRRAMQTLPALEQLWRDVRYAARVLKKSPTFTAAVVATLALSVGANTAIFSVVSGLLLHPLPYEHPGRIMMLEDRWLPRFPSFEATPQEFQAWRAQSRAFEQLAAFAPAGFTITGDGRPERIPGARVSANLPSLLGLSPIVGCGFLDGDDRKGSDRVVLYRIRSMAAPLRRRSSCHWSHPNIEQRRVYGYRSDAAEFPVPARGRDLETDGLYGGRPQ